MKGRKEGRKTNGRGENKWKRWTQKMNFDYFIVISQFLVIFPQKPDKQKPVVVFIVHSMYFCLILFSQCWKYFYTNQKSSGVCGFSRGVGRPLTSPSVFRNYPHSHCVLSLISLADCDSITLTSYVSIMRMIQTSNTLCLFMITLKLFMQLLVQCLSSLWDHVLHEDGDLVHLCPPLNYQSLGGHLLHSRDSISVEWISFTGQQTCRPNGRETRRTGNHRSPRFRGCLHLGSEDSHWNVCANIQILCWLVWQNSGKCKMLFPWRSFLEENGRMFVSL